MSGAMHDALGEIAAAARLAVATLHRMDEPGIAACRRIGPSAAPHRAGAALGATFIHQTHAWLARPGFRLDPSTPNAPGLRPAAERMRGDAGAAVHALGLAPDAIASQATPDDGADPMPAFHGLPLLELAIPHPRADLDDILAHVEVCPARLAVDLGDGAVALPGMRPAGAVVLVTASPTLEPDDVPPAWAAAGWSPDHSRAARCAGRTPGGWPGRAPGRRGGRPGARAISDISADDVPRPLATVRRPMTPGKFSQACKATRLALGCLINLHHKAKQRIVELDDVAGSQCEGDAPLSGGLDHLQGVGVGARTLSEACGIEVGFGHGSISGAAGVDRVAVGGVVPAAAPSYAEAVDAGKAVANG